MVTIGTGGQGVTVGNSSLSGQLDLSDSFTGTADGSANPNRPYVAAVQPAAAYVLENTYGNLGRSWNTGIGFSFASDAGATNPGFVDGTPAYPGNAGSNSNTSGSGSGTGFTQTGGGGIDYGVAYGLRNRFVAQFDAIQVADRIDITSSNGIATIGGPQGLSVFIRPSTSGNQIGLYNGSVETPTGFSSGVTLGTWNNYAVEFNRFNNTVSIYTNETPRGTVNLNTFAGGIYANFGTGNVNFGANLGGGDRTWTDNAQIGLVAGTTLPGPASLVSYVPFNESASGNGTAFDQIHANNGTFAAATPRTTGLVGTGAIAVNGNAANSANLGSGQNGVNNLFSFTSGITVEALFSSTTLTNGLHEIFRKEDGNNRILLSFQNDANINNGSGQFVGGTDDNLPGISFGLNVNGTYAEMDVELDGQSGRPTLAALNNGLVHHLVATYDAATGLKSLYIDGALIGQLDLPDNLSIVSGGAANAFVGSSGGSSEAFNGVLDEFAIYNRALSGSDIYGHYINSLNGLSYFATPEPSSVALWSIMAIGLICTGMAKLRRRA